MQQQLAIDRTFRISDLKEIATAGGPCITLCIPLQPAPNTSQRDYTRLKSAIQEAEAKLKQLQALDDRQSRELIESLYSVGDEADSWGGEGGTLVVLRSPEVFRAFEVRDHYNQTVHVGPSFHLFHMLGTLQRAEQLFYILALSQKHVRLLRATPDGAEEVSLGDTPTNLEDWLNTRMPNASPSRVKDEEQEVTRGSFNSVHDRDQKDGHILNFFHQINKAVADVLRNEKDPLVLAGVEYQRSMYKDISSYNQVVDGVGGAPDSLTGGELHKRALECVQDFFAEPARKALATWENAGGTERAATKMGEIVKAAFQGRVAHLFAAENAQTPGVINRETLTLGNGGPSEDLVNAAALQTIAYGGDVFLLNPDHVPGGGQVAAVLRF
jgi:hypothetical protein